MRLRIGRTGAAVLFTVLALGLPCCAWYVAGSRAALEEARRLEQAPLIDARQEAEALAHRLGVRLESLRQSESRRPITDYEPHDFEDDCSCETRLASPLAAGPPDPLVWAHFQINEVGELTLPTLPGEGTRGDQAVRTIQQAILERLECGATERVASAAQTYGPATEMRVEEGDHEWVITVGAFNWHTVRLDDENALIAVREVQTPRAGVRQGFVVRAGALEELLTPAPASVRPGEPDSPTFARLPIDGQTWVVELDASAAGRAGAAEAGRVLTRFNRVFAGGVLAAVLGGSLVVGLVWQADRVARQRVRFAASAAHELRTPLTGLRMYAEMLADGTGDPARSKTYANRIAGETERLGRVVTNLLSFSKLQRGALTVQALRGDLAPAVGAAVEQLRPILEARGAILETSFEDELPSVWFDRDAVHQILQNLLDNAAKYGAGADQRSIRVALQRRGEGVRLSVIDHGPGVAAFLKRRLFEPFARDSSAAVSEGLGLGLALVSALAQAQGATAGHSDVEGGGACFSVTFDSGLRANPR